MSVNPGFATVNYQASLADPYLYEGDSGTTVVDLQKLLTAKGFHLAIDGFFGPRTLDAVIKFQRQRGLEVDGVVSPLTWSELRKDHHPHIRLTDIGLYYDPTNFPHQTTAVDWLQSQIPSMTMDEFAKRWYNLKSDLGHA